MSQVGVFTIAGLVGMASSTRWIASLTGWCGAAGLRGGRRRRA
jgi:hypothetical protein